MTVLFHVGDDPTKSFVDLYDQVFAHLDELPPGASQPDITPMCTDDIPIVVLTLHGARYDRGQLGRCGAAAHRRRSNRLPAFRRSPTYGGRAARGRRSTRSGAACCLRTLARCRSRARSARRTSSRRPGRCATPRARCTCTRDAVPERGRKSRRTIVGVRDGVPVALRDVANVRAALRRRRRDASDALYWTATNRRSASRSPRSPGRTPSRSPTTSSTPSRAAELPPGVTVSVTRDYGEKANLAVNELIERLVEAIGIVVLLLLVLGWRQAIVVATAIPLTLFVTLGVGDARASNDQPDHALRADSRARSARRRRDRHGREHSPALHANDPNAPREPSRPSRAVGEIASPTALATLTVMLSFLPMLFVTGMMGPYMRPIPINVPVAMFASLFVAFAITPWATYHLLRNAQAEDAHATPRWVAPFRDRLARLFASNPRARLALSGCSCAGASRSHLRCRALQLVQFRMLPRRQRNDVSREHRRAAVEHGRGDDAHRRSGRCRARHDAARCEITRTFVGTNAVPDLSSLFQGTVFRNAPNHADIRVNLVPKDRRKHAVGRYSCESLRPRLQAIAARYGAHVAHRADAARTAGAQHDLRKDLRSRSRRTPRDRIAHLIGMLQARARRRRRRSERQAAAAVAICVEVDPAQGRAFGRRRADVAQTLAMALHGATVSRRCTRRSTRARSTSSCGSRRSTAAIRRRFAASDPDAYRRARAARQIARIVVATSAAAALSRRLSRRDLRRRRDGRTQLHLRRDRGDARACAGIRCRRVTASIGTANGI